MKTVRTHLFMMILFAIVTSSLLAKDSTVKEREPGVSDVVIACSYLAGFQNISLPPETRCPEVWKAINTAGVEGVAFSHISFFVQSSAVGNTYGFRRNPRKTLDESGVPDIGLLFVTDPLVDLQGRILVILAQVGPEKTTIFTLDKDWHSTALYDSFSQAASITLTPRMGSVYQVRVLGPARFLLQERRTPGGALTATSNRAFVLDVTKGKMELSVAQQ